MRAAERFLKETGPDAPRQPHLYTEQRGFEFRYIDNIPTVWRHHFCMCDMFHYKVKWKEGFEALPHRCAECNKISILDFHKCSGCDEFFVRNFRHPRFCNYSDHVRCWDCCEALPREENCCGANRWRRERFGDLLTPPVENIRPARVYTEEELWTVDEFII